MSGGTFVMAAPSSVIVWLRTAKGWHKKHTIPAPVRASSTFGWDVAVTDGDVGVVRQCPDGDGAYRFCLYR